jgi:hypothetical protein
MKRFHPLTVLIAVVTVAACSYESSGTTTTTTEGIDDRPPPTAPASIAFGDQRVEGSTVTIETVTLPATGFIVLQDDVAGAPGTIIGLSEVIGPGRIDGVPVPFFVPLLEDAAVHATVHIDVDRDRSFLYEPPDDFVDVPALEDDGSVATSSAAVVLLPPLAPAAVAVEEARIDGTAIDVAAVTLPAPGFVAVQRNEAGRPGAVLGASALLGEGTTTDLRIELDPALRVTGLIWVVAYVDRDEDGLLDPDGLDEPGEQEDGEPAVASPVMTVVPLDPTSIAVTDQEGDGTSITVAEASLPSPGFLELLLDSDGEPGRRIGVSELIVSTATEVRIALDRPLDADAIVWVRARIDFDEDGVLDGIDPVGLDGDRTEVEESLEYVYVDPDAEDEDEEDS